MFQNVRSVIASMLIVVMGIGTGFPLRADVLLDEINQYHSVAPEGMAPEESREFLLGIFENINEHLNSIAQLLALDGTEEGGIGMATPVPQEMVDFLMRHYTHAFREARYLMWLYKQFGGVVTGDMQYYRAVTGVAYETFRNNFNRQNALAFVVALNTFVGSIQNGFATLSFNTLGTRWMALINRTAALSTELEGVIAALENPLSTRVITVILRATGIGVVVGAVVTTGFYVHHSYAMDGIRQLLREAEGEEARLTAINEIIREFRMNGVRVRTRICSDGVLFFSPEGTLLGAAEVDMNRSNAPTMDQWLNDIRNRIPWRP